MTSAEFEFGNLTLQDPISESSRRRGTKVLFIPDASIFKHYKYRLEYVERMIKNYVYLNPGLTIDLNGLKFFQTMDLRTYWKTKRI